MELHHTPKGKLKKIETIIYRKVKKIIIGLQVPPRFEFGSLDSESRVLTITPWDLTNRARGPYWGVLARGRGSTYKKDRGPRFPSTGRASLVSKKFIIWHSGRACFEFVDFRKQKNPKRGNGPYGEILTKKEPIRMLGFTSRLHCHITMEFTISIAFSFNKTA